ncbi:MAG TPA: hypothetical protein VF183_13805 [Acidimicrobiales bacterium]
MAIVVGVAVLAALVAGVIVSVVGSGGDDSGDSSPRVTGALMSPVVSQNGSILPTTDPPASYRIVYRIETAGAEDVIVRTEEVSVRRPFDAQLVVRSDDGSASPDLVVRSSMGLYADVTDPERTDVGEGLPSAALGDLRFDGVLEDLVTAGLMVPKERRTVLGRECQVYRTGQTVESLALSNPTDTTYADVCIDASGLVLEQVAYEGGTPVHYEIATSIEIAPQFAPDTFTIEGEPAGLDEGGVVLDPVDPAAAPVPGYHTFTAEGFDASVLGEHVGRYRMRVANDEAVEEPTSTAVGPTSVGTPGDDDVVETYVDVYVSGASFVIVQQGPRSAQPTRDTAAGADVAAGAFGTARVVFGVTGSTLVAATDTWFVEITAPVPAARLGELAAGLAPAA